ncbi:hypothetical protein R6Q59_035025 [Mikania micrantha]
MNLEVHEEVKPTSKLAIEDEATIKANSQAEQLEMTSESISDQTLESKLEHTSGKYLEDGKENNEEDATLASENEIKNNENQNETTKNTILTGEAALVMEKENEIGQVSYELKDKSRPNQTNEKIGYSKPIPTQVTEEKAESQIQIKQDAENLSCSSKASIIIETSKLEIHEQTIKFIGDVKDEASKDKTILDLEDSKEAVAINEVRDKQIISTSLLKDYIFQQSLSLLTKVLIKQIKRSSSRPVELHETINSVEDAKFITDSLIVKDETFTISNEDSETIASEFETKENPVTEENIIKANADKETVRLDKSLEDDSAKTTYDSIMSSIEQDVVARSDESRGLELAHYDSQEQSEDDTWLSQNDKDTEDPEVLPSVEKDDRESVDRSIEEVIVIDDQKHEKDLDHETEIRIADIMSNVKCLEIESPSFDTKEAMEFINQENQKEQKKEADESTEDVIPIEDVKTSTKEPVVGGVNLGVPSVMDTTADEANKNVEVDEANEHLESTCDQSKPAEEDSGIKQESLELNEPGALVTAATEILKISRKDVTDDLLKVSQSHLKIQKYEVSAYTVDEHQSPKESHLSKSTESKMLTENLDSSLEQGETIAKLLVLDLKADSTSCTDTQCSNIVLRDQKEKSKSVEPAKFKMANMLHEPAKENAQVAEKLIGEKDSALTEDQQMDKEEIGAKTDEEDDEKMGSCSDVPVLVEASKDRDAKVKKNLIIYCQGLVQRSSIRSPR